MGDTPSTTPVPTVPATKTPRDHALQSKQLAEAIAAAERHIQSIRSNPDLILALAPIGFNETELDRGLALARSAQEKFNARQIALATSTETKNARDHFFTAVRSEMSAYRQTVQVNYTGPERTNLGASGKIPVDLEKCRTVARSAYTTALRSPYAEVLAGFGFTTERINLALAGLDALSTSDSACKAAQGAAAAATEARDEAGAALALWMTRFRKLSRVALKGKPELLARLKAGS